MTINLGKNIRQKEGFTAFVPDAFPPRGGFPFSASILKKNDQATRLLGKLDGITKLLPDADFFLLMYLRKDAASSSQIEGTQATMMDAIEAEANVNASLPADVDDILHYIEALNYGMKRVTEDTPTISNQLISTLQEWNSILNANCNAMQRGATAMAVGF